MKSHSEIRLNTPLRVDQIEFRVQSVNNGGYARILAYKNARVDMDRLDAVYGTGYWKREHKRIDGKEFCRVSVWNRELEQWVYVEDCGVPSNAEAQKGESSDAFKRACFNLGIGRELYAFPEISIKLNGRGDNQSEEWYKKTVNNKSYASSGWGLKLDEWDWYIESDPKTGHPVFIAARDQNLKARYKWGSRLEEAKNAN